MSNSAFSSITRINTVSGSSYQLFEFRSGEVVEEKTLTQSPAYSPYRACLQFLQ